MPLAAGDRVGPYEITALIGVGGMGEVYRATDTSLNRDVAIKVLPEEVAQDAERLARFEREARTLAALNHPGIAIIHGFEKTGPARALVMEFIDGPTLSDRIAAGALPVEDALPIARQIADALQAAHDQGIVHRDLKPANIKVRSDGTVKVLDFGLAKTLEATATAAGHAASPAVTSPAMTQAGIILGTAAYMSPEQAKGRAADKRSDVWALGCVVYEMLAARRAFAGEDISETIASILRSEPDWSALPPTVPAPVLTLLKRALEKDRRHRVADVAAFSFVLGDLSVLTHAPGRATRRTSPALAAAAVVGASALAAAAWWAGTPARVEDPRIVSRLLVPLRAEEQIISPIANALAVSPDGRYLGYLANGRIYLRPLDSLEATIVPGSDSNILTAGATRRPQFSPDSKWIAFLKDGELRKAAVAGGPPVAVAAVPSTALYAFEPDGAVLFLQDQTLFRLPAAGGTPVPVLHGLTRRVQHFQMLPGGTQVLLTEFPGGTIDPSRFEVVLRSIADGSERLVLRGGVQAQYVPTGHLVYFSNGSLLKVAFDLDTLTTSGAPEPVTDQVLSGGAPGLPVSAAHVAISPSGTLAYIRGDARATNLRTLLWVDRTGREESLGLRDEPYVYPRLSPDNRQIGVTMRHDVRGDIWILDVLRRAGRPLTTDPLDERYLVWMPDGIRVAFGANRGDDAGTWLQAADGSGAPVRLAGFPRSRFQNFVPTSVTPSGDRLVVTSTSSSGADIWLVPLSGDEPMPLVQSANTERNGEVSPDGRWFAYEEVVDGQSSINVRPFPDVHAGVWRVSASGSQPLWSRDATELFFLDEFGVVHGVTVERGRSFAFSTPAKMLPRAYIALIPAFAGRQYDISRDGKRFLMMSDAGRTSEVDPPTITVVQNWFDELRRR